MIMRILVVEDTEKLAAYISKGLTADGYLVDLAYDGMEAERMSLTGVYDMIVLDLMLPKKDGLSVCRTLRERELDIPILMLTAKGETDDRVTGLDSGADDYLAKPFDFNELRARIRALLRRPSERMPDTLKLRDLTVDLSRRVVIRDGQEVKLSSREFTLLEYLIRNRNIVLSREQIIGNCWGWASESYSNVVDAHVKKLRKKLSPPGKSGKVEYIRTVRGVGYVIDE